MSTRLSGAGYRLVFERGRSLRTRMFSAWRMDDANADRMAGVVVSKKTFHDAVDRNRAKRLLREAFRLLVKADVIPAGTQWVLVARPAIRSADCAAVMREMERLCARS